jgi:hypothetical protein
MNIEKPKNTNMPQEISPTDELIYWLRERCKHWTRQIDARNIHYDRELGMREGQLFLGKEIEKKLKDLGL